MDKIQSLRHRHFRLVQSIEHFEGRVEEQASMLKRLNKPRGFGADENEEEDSPPLAQTTQDHFMSQEDVKKEEEEIRGLERKRQVLEERVSALGKDITGVLR